MFKKACLTGLQLKKKKSLDGGRRGPRGEVGSVGWGKELTQPNRKPLEHLKQENGRI